MIDVVYVANGQRIRAQSQNPHFLLTAPGASFSSGHPSHSNYDGLFVDIAGRFKVISSLSPIQAQFRHLELSETSAECSFDGATQRFSLFAEGLRAECNGELALDLDCKRLYDESDAGRIYRISADQDGAVAVANICYTKYSDGSLQHKEYELFACIATTMRLERLDEWKQQEYAYDAWRGTKSTPWVYRAFKLSGAGIVTVAAAANALDARKQALGLLVKKTQRTDAPSLPSMQQIVWRSLASLKEATGIMAGLPWFFQQWSRDELIACGGLLAAKRYGDVMRILDKWYSAVRDDGTLPAIYPGQGLASSDAPGWLGKRTRDLLMRLSEENLLHELPAEMIIRWRECTGIMLDSSMSRIKDGLIWNAANTTWMDTQYDDDGRAGARIEIQALHLVLYDAHAHLCTLTKIPVQKSRSETAQAMIDAVHTRLVAGSVLLDGLHSDGSQDLEMRPNIFIAWYAAPKLFKDEEWAGFFRQALPDLWLEWGGLSSLGKKSKNYQPRYTGEDIRSYHRGDSWYFVNNIAAIALQSVDPRGFRNEVRELLSASLRDLLSQGYCGHCSELAEASTQRPAGCHAQAWSASTLLEALQHIDQDIIRL
jgi:hypothetical protein